MKNQKEIVDRRKRDRAEKETHKTEDGAAAPNSFGSP